MSRMMPVLTRGPIQLLPSDSAAVFQYGREHSSDFLAKVIRCRYPTVSLENTLLVSTFFTVTLNSHKVQDFHTVSDSTVGSVLGFGVVDTCSICDKIFMFF
jgi:hypothetical protein